MGEIYLTSDTHFMHQAEFLWRPRGFSSVEEMNEAIIERWNSVVKKDDIVWHLGDTCLSDTKKGVECFKRLNGQIFLIFGNHDTDNRINALFLECKNLNGGWYAYRTKCGKKSIYLSHYPTITSNWDDKNFSQHVFSMHGHTHQRTNFLNPSNPFIYHIGLDSHNCTPVHIEEAISDIRDRWNEIGQLPTSMKPENIPV